MKVTVIQSAINLSTTASDVVDEIVHALRLLSGLRVADYSSDPDHNRTVITLLGDEESLEKAVMTIFQVAEKRIDISQHRGEHPRIGAVDVVPFTPWRGVRLKECQELAWKVGERVAQELNVPVYFYAEAARVPEHRDLSVLRRGGYETLREEIRTVPERRPDLGPLTLHPTLGAVAIGARGPLVAFNVNLNTQDVAIARYIAEKLRGEKGGLRFVKAIGINLQSRGMVQVSMNLLDFRRSTLYQALELVRLEAQRFGVQVKGAEIIGLVPLEALVDVAGFYLGVPDLTVRQVVEDHLLAMYEENF